MWGFPQTIQAKKRQARPKLACGFQLAKAEWCTRISRSTYDNTRRYHCSDRRKENRKRSEEGVETERQSDRLERSIDREKTEISKVVGEETVEQKESYPRMLGLDEQLNRGRYIGILKHHNVLVFRTCDVSLVFNLAQNMLIFLHKSLKVPTSSSSNKRNQKQLIVKTVSKARR